MYVATTHAANEQQQNLNLTSNKLLYIRRLEKSMDDLRYDNKYFTNQAKGNLDEKQRMKL